MEFTALFFHRSPTDALLRKRYYEAKAINSDVLVNGPQFDEALRELDALGYRFTDPPQIRPEPSTFQMSLAYTYTPDDWAACELFETDFHFLADVMMRVQEPLAEDGSALILLETMDQERPNFVLAGTREFAFVRDAVKKEMEQERFVGLQFSRGGMLRGKQQRGGEIELGKGRLLRKWPLTSEHIWQIRSNIELPAPVAVPEEDRTHRPLAHRAELPEEMRSLGVVEHRLVFTRSSLDALGTFDIGFLTQPPHQCGRVLQVLPPRMVVSRRLKDWLTMRLRPEWEAEVRRNAARPWKSWRTPALHEKWRPVTIVEG